MTYFINKKRPSNFLEPMPQERCGLSLFMIEKVINRNGQKVTEVRSKAGKLLFIKTSEGYEVKCPRTKQICLVKYEVMINDCLGSKSCQDVLNKLKKEE